FMMKGTPCSRRCRASLKTLGKTRYIARSSNPAKSGFVLGREVVVGATRLKRSVSPFPRHSVLPRAITDQKLL
ncbi:MAG: hypothetical protein ABSF67_15925, partial [Roseiarcus sp.]